jgi:hypothetical protein
MDLWSCRPRRILSLLDPARTAWADMLLLTFSGQLHSVINIQDYWRYIAEAFLVISLHLLSVVYNGHPDSIESFDLSILESFLALDL